MPNKQAFFKAVGKEHEKGPSLLPMLSRMEDPALIEQAALRQQYQLKGTDVPFGVGIIV